MNKSFLFVIPSDVGPEDIGLRIGEKLYRAAADLGYDICMARTGDEAFADKWNFRLFFHKSVSTGLLDEVEKFRNTCSFDVFVLIGSGYGAAGALRGVETARELAADIVLMGEGLKLCSGQALSEFCGMVYALVDDGVSGGGNGLSGVKPLDSRGLMKMLGSSSGALGVF